MPCLCQYFATDLELRLADSLKVSDNIIIDDSIEKVIYSNELSTEEVKASELVTCKTEIYTLKRMLSLANISAGNMEMLMKQMIEKQNLLIMQIFELRKLNEDFRLQLVADRNNQAVERSGLLKELHEIKLLLQDRSSDMEKVLQQNSDLTNALRDANGKIYTMGMKFLKLKNKRFWSRDGSSSSHILSD